MHKFFLIENQTLEEIRAHLTEAIAHHPGDKNLHEALQQLETGLHTLESFGVSERTHESFLTEAGTVEEIQSHLREAIARHPNDKNLHEALHQLETGLNTSDLVPSDFKEESEKLC